MSLWQGRIDTQETGPALRWHQVIKSWNPQDKLDQAPALLGFACDEGVRRNQGRAGAYLGPTAIRQALANLTYLQYLPPIDAGNIECNGNEMEQAQALLAEKITDILSHNGQPIILGGGHEMAWGSFLGLVNYIAPIKNHKRIGIINFDAHFDLRNPQPQPNSGTPFRQIAEWCEQNNQEFNYLMIGLNPSANTTALFEYAKQHNVAWRVDIDCTPDELKDTERVLSAFLDKIDELYVTICMDVFPAYAAPGVSAPASLGIEPNLVIKVIQTLKTLCQLQQVNWRISDIAELNPEHDQDSRTAKLAARLVHELAF
jgi:formiminoglutamase